VSDLLNSQQEAMLKHETREHLPVDANCKLILME
jgi:hypothetical protein